MENNNDNESPKKSESADSLNIDAAKPVGVYVLPKSNFRDRYRENS